MTDPSIEPTTGESKGEAVRTNMKLRIFSFGTLFASGCFLLFALTISDLHSRDAANEVRLITKAKQGVTALIPEAKNEAAVDEDSLDYAHNQFNDMVQILVDTMMSLNAEKTFEDTEAKSLAIITKLQSLADDLSSRSGDYADPETAIMLTANRLSDLDTTILAMNTGSVPEQYPRIENQTAINTRRLSDELGKFELAVKTFASKFPLRADLLNGDLTDDAVAYTLDVVRAAEMVCQESRVTYFLLSFEMDVYAKSPAGRKLTERFVSLEEQALDLCTKLGMALPMASHPKTLDRKAHVKKFTASIKRRLDYIKAELE